MGLLVAGKWQDTWYYTKANGGRYQREEAPYRNWVTADGSPGPSGRGGFAAQPGRYHLYVAYACPWAHRTLIFRHLKGLEQHVGVSFVHWHMGENGWTFEPDDDGIVGDRLGHARYLYEIYLRDDDRHTGRVTVPALFDRETQRIVSTESSEIIRMFNAAFDEVGAAPGDYYPTALRGEIDALNARIYASVNNGVYRAGFATTQEAYEEAVQPLFDTLDILEGRLAESRYLFGAATTEADWRLFTTLLRFDPVYFGHFKCNIRRLADYPMLWAYVRDLYQLPGIAATFNLQHTKRHYYGSHRTINPSGIVPVGPIIDYGAPSGRG